MCKTIYAKVDFNMFRFAFEISKGFYNANKKDVTFIKAVERGKEILKLNKRFAKEMERRIGFNPKKDEDIAAFGFAAHETHYLFHQEPKVLQTI